MSEAGPRVNGPASPTGKYIDGIDPDDPQYIKNLQRPAEVKEDLQQMENRSRVSLILNSQAFKEELEQVVEEQLRNGPYPASLIALQQITDLLLPHSKGSIGSLARASSVIPINDLRGVDSLAFTKGEKVLRCKLAALYRLVDLCGWSHGIHNHISARVSTENEHFLLNPFGLTYSEITASSLVKVDIRGDILELGSTHLGVYKAGFSVHSAIHQARPDIKCIVHLHTPAAVAVSALKCGLLAMSQEALICGNISYHDFQGIAVDAEEREKLARNLGVHNKILVLRNRGVLACGETVEEAFHFTFNVMSACEAQVKAIPVGLDNIVIPSAEAREQTYKVANQGGGGVDSTGRKWKTGELEFEALMRTLDNSGFRTGYVFKMPVVKQEKKDRSNSEVEIPPSSSSFTYVFDGDIEHSKYASPVKAAMERQKKAYKAGWLTTPNAYKKKEVEEIGTSTPKRITKWVSDEESPNRPGGTPIKIENANQFAPQGVNPKEYKEKQKSIKKDYYEERVHAGPQSRILEGISWDEAQRAREGQLSGTGDQFIVVGAASKGIIQRDHQHNAVVYRQYYAANPFENMSEAEIDEYQAEVQRRERGEPVFIEEPIPEPVVEVPREAPIRQQPVEPDRRETEARRVSRPQEDEDEIAGLDRRQHQQQGYHTINEEMLLAELADKVVQTVIHDALSVARHGKGQQKLMGTEPLQKHNFFYHGPVGSQISSDQRDLNNMCNATHYVAVNSVNNFCHDDKCSDFHHHNNSGRTYMGMSRVRCCAYSRNHNEAVGAVTEELCQAEAYTSDDSFQTYQQNSKHLCCEQSKHGMTIRFSEKSAVMRTELSRGGTHEEISTAAFGSCCEDISAMASGPYKNPETDILKSESSELSVDHNACTHDRNISSVIRKRQSTLTIKPQPYFQTLPSKNSTVQVTDDKLSESNFLPAQSKSSVVEKHLKYPVNSICDAFKKLQHNINMQPDIPETTKTLIKPSMSKDIFNKMDRDDINFHKPFETAQIKGMQVVGEEPVHACSTNITEARLIQEYKSCIQKIQCAAASCERLENTVGDQHKTSFQVTRRLNMIRCRVQLALFFNAKSKEHLVDNYWESQRNESFTLPKTVLEGCPLIKHTDVMRHNSHQTVILAYPVTRDTISPMHNTTNVPRTYGSEGRQRQNYPTQLSRTPENRRRTAADVADSGGSTPKQKWVPKQKHERRNLEQTVGGGIDKDARRREDEILAERNYGRQRLNLDVNQAEGRTDSLRSEDALRREREEKKARRNEAARTIHGETRPRHQDFSRSGRKENRRDQGDDRAHRIEDQKNRDYASRYPEYAHDYGSDDRNEPNSRTNRLDISESGRRGDSRSDLRKERQYKHDENDDSQVKSSGESSEEGKSERNAHLSSVPNITEDSDNLIKELKHKIEDRKSRILVASQDVEKSRLVGKLGYGREEPTSKWSGSIVAKAEDLSPNQANAVTASVKSRELSDNNIKEILKTESRHEDEASLTSMGDGQSFQNRRGDYRKRDERDQRSSYRYRGRSEDRHRLRERRDYEDDIRNSDDERMRDRRNSDDEGRRRKRDDKLDSSIDYDQSGDRIYSKRYRGRSQDRHRLRGRRDYEDDIRNSDDERRRDRRNSDDEGRRRKRDDKLDSSIDYDQSLDRSYSKRYRGRSQDRHRLRGRRDYEDDRRNSDDERRRDRMSSDDEGRRRKRNDKLDSSIDYDQSLDRSYSKRRPKHSDHRKHRSDREQETHDDLRDQSEKKTYDIDDDTRQRRHHRNEDMETHSKRFTDRGDLINSLDRRSRVTHASKNIAKVEEELEPFDKIPNKTQMKSGLDDVSKLGRESRAAYVHPDHEDRIEKIKNIAEPLKMKSEVKIVKEGYDNRKKIEHQPEPDIGYIREKRNRSKDKKVDDFVQLTTEPELKSAIEKPKTLLVEPSHSRSNSPRLNENVLRDYNLPSEIHPVIDSPLLDTLPKVKELEGSLPISEDTVRLQHHRGPDVVKSLEDQVPAAGISFSDKKHKIKDSDLHSPHNIRSHKTGNQRNDSEAVKDVKAGSNVVKKTKDNLLAANILVQHLKVIDTDDDEITQKKREPDTVKNILPKQKRHDKDSRVHEKEKIEVEAEHKSSRPVKKSGGIQHEFSEDGGVNDYEEIIQKQIRETDVYEEVRSRPTIEKAVTNVKRIKNRETDILNEGSDITIKVKDMESGETPNKNVKSDVYRKNRSRSKDDRARSNVSKEDKARSDVSKEDRDRSDVSKENKAKSDISKEDRTRSDVYRKNRSRSDASRKDRAKSDVSKEDRARSDVSKEDRARSDVSKEDRARSDVSKEDRARSDISKEDRARSDLPKEDRTRSDVRKNRSRSDVSRKDRARFDVSIEDRAISDVSKEDKARSDVSKEDRAIDVSKEDRARSDVSKEDRAQSDVSKEDRARSDVSKENRARSDVYSDARARSHVYRLGKVMSDVSKEYRTMSDLSKADEAISDVTKNDRASSKVSKEHTVISDVYREDIARSAIPKEDIARSDDRKEDRDKSGIYTEGRIEYVPKEYQTRSDFYREKKVMSEVPKEDKIRHEVLKEDRVRYDVHTGYRARSDVHKEDRARSDVHKEYIDKSGVYREDRAVSEVIIENIVKSDVYKEGTARYNANKEDISNSNFVRDDKARSTRDKYAKRGNTFELKNRQSDNTEFAEEKVMKVENVIEKKSRESNFGDTKINFSKPIVDIDEIPELPLRANIAKPIEELNKLPKIEKMMNVRLDSARDVHALETGGNISKKIEKVNVHLDSARDALETDGNISKKIEKVNVRLDSARDALETDGNISKKIEKVNVRLDSARDAFETDGNISKKIEKVNVRLDSARDVHALETGGNISKKIEKVNVHLDSARDALETGGNISKKIEKVNVRLDSARDALETGGNISKKIEKVNVRLDSARDALKTDGNISKKIEKVNVRLDSARDVHALETDGNISKKIEKVNVRLDSARDALETDGNISKKIEKMNVRLDSARDVHALETGGNISKKIEKKMQDIHFDQEDRTGSLVKITAENRSEVFETLPSDKKRRVEGRGYKAVVAQAERNITEFKTLDDKNKGYNIYKDNSGKLSQVTPETAVKNVKEAQQYLMKRNEKNVININDVFDDEKLATEKREFTRKASAKSTKVVSEIVVKARRGGDKWYPVKAEQERGLSDTDDETSVIDNRSLTRGGSIRSSRSAAESAVQISKGAKRSYPVKRIESSMPHADISYDDTSRSDKSSRTRTSEMLPEAAIKVRNEAKRLYPVRRSEGNVPESYHSNEDRKIPEREIKTRTSKMVSEVPVKRTWRSESDADVLQDRRIDDRVEKRFQDSSFTSPKHTWENSEIPEISVKMQEKPKYAGFVKRTGRGGRISHPMRSVSLEGDSDETHQYKLDTTKRESKIDSPIKSASQGETKSGSLLKDDFIPVDENPIELSIDNDNKENHENPPSSPKKGIFSLFSCVGGKSTDVAKMMEKSKTKRPTAYYEEGEKRKIKKLSREKDKEEKKLLYFEKPEDASEMSRSGDESYGISSGEPQEELFDNPPPLPDVPPPEPTQIRKSDRYKKRPPPFRPPRPLSAHIDPEEGPEALENTNSEDDHSSQKMVDGNQDVELDIPNLSREERGKLSTFMSFGKSNIGPRIARPVSGQFGHAKEYDITEPTSTNANISENFVEIEERLERKPREIYDKSTGYSQEVEHEIDRVGVTLRSKPSLDQETRRSGIISQTSSIRKDVTSVVSRRSETTSVISRRSEARLSDFINNVPPPDFDDDDDFDFSSDTSNEALFPPPPDKLNLSSSSTL